MNEPERTIFGELTEWQDRDTDQLQKNVARYMSEFENKSPVELIQQYENLFTDNPTLHTREIAGQQAAAISNLLEREGYSLVPSEEGNPFSEQVWRKAK